MTVSPGKGSNGKYVLELNYQSKCERVGGYEPRPVCSSDYYENNLLTTKSLYIFNMDCMPATAFTVKAGDLKPV